MKKNKDWTRVLQERLQVASLPLEDGWASSSFAGSTGESPARTPKTPWWPWALAGVAAALAVVLLLRPVSNPEQETKRLVESAPISNAGKEESVVLLPQSDQSLLADGVSAERQPSPLTRPTAPDSAGQRAQASAHPTHGLPLEPSSNQAPDEDGEGNNELPSSNQAVGEDGGANISEPSSKQVDFEEERLFLDGPGSTRRVRKGKIALRLNAAMAGTSFSGGAVLYTYPSHSDLSFGQKPENEEQTVSVPKAPALPVAVGVSLSLPLSRSWTLSAGLDYMQRDGYRLYNDLPQSLTLHYLGIPVDLQYYFNPESRWRFYLGAGLHAAKCIAATGGQPLQDPVLFSGSVMAGTDFRLFPGVRLYLSPALSVPFNRSAYINNWDDRLQFQVHAGLSFDLK